MTSRKSSANPRRYTFRTTLTSNFLLPLLNTILLTLLLPAYNLMQFLQLEQDAIGSEGAAPLRETYTYFLFGAREMSGDILLIAGCVLLSGLLGVMVFRFIASKKTVNVYYSLGITRKALFTSKYLAGILMLVVSVAIPMLLNLMINISYLGSSWQLWNAAAYYFWSISILCCFAFTVTAAVFSCVGTVAEGCFFPFVILGAPTIVLYCLQFLMATLYGNPYGVYFFGSNVPSSTLPAMFQAFNPLLFLRDGLVNLWALDGSGKTIPSMYGLEGTAWSRPDFLPLILWTAAVVAVMFLGMYLFRRRKAEICGFLGANRVLNFLITFLLGFLGFGLVVRFTEETLGMAVAILLGLLVYAVIYCVVDLALIRNGREFLRGMVKLPAHLGIALAAGILFATGLLGFSSRLPEVSEIRSVSVTVPTDCFIGTGCSSTGYGWVDYDWASTGDLLNGITGEEDLQLVRAVHEQIIKSGDQPLTSDDPNVAREEQSVAGRVQFVYELKNGKKLLRSYSHIPVSALNALIRVEDTAAAKEAVKELLTQPANEEDYWQEYYRSPIQESDAIALLSPYMEQETPLELSQTQRKALLQAIAGDITAQKAEQRYFPTQQPLGYLRITNDDMLHGGAEARSPFASASYGYMVGLTPQMSRTLQFLRLNGLGDALMPAAELESVEVIRAHEDEFYQAYNYDYQSFYFLGAWQSQAQFEEMQEEMAQGGAPDPTFSGAARWTGAQAQEIASRSHIAYYYGVDGYFLRAKLADGKGYTCMFLPESAAPQYVKDAVK